MTTPEQRIEDALKTVVDPELGVNILDLGLVYGIDIGEDKTVITMTMTSAACPMHNMLAQMAENAVHEALGGDREVEVKVVFDPPWNPDMMSDEARRLLG